MAGVLAIFAHPDDESLVAGGTLAACAAAGLPVRILSMTRGEEGPCAAPDLTAGGGLGTLRVGELEAAARVLGVEAAECLDFPDGLLDDLEWEELADALVGPIRRWQPTTVITFGADGLYWHADHVAVHHAVHVALARTGADWVYEATWPEGLLRGLLDAMGARGLPTGLWGLDPAMFGVPAETITTTLDVGPFLDRKLRALRSHASQLSDEHVLAAIPDDLARRYLAREHFIRSRAGAAGPDWLEALVGRMA